MSTFDSYIAASTFPALQTQFGQAVTYQAPGVDDVSLTAIVGSESADMGEDPEGRDWRRQRSVTFATATVSPIDIDNGSIVIDEESWSIVAIESETANLVKLRVEFSHGVEAGRPDLRSQR